ncbi:MAG: hypothetical protein ICV84_03250 [Flavisolibacter sp.]|nr:hypothetical protein [Flavisolibacter sp.]
MQPEQGSSIRLIRCVSFMMEKLVNQSPQQVPNTAIVSAKDLTDKGDRLHFDTPSSRKPGKRYAEAMKRLQETGNASKRSKK